MPKKSPFDASVLEKALDRLKREFSLTDAEVVSILSMKVDTKFLALDGADRTRKLNEIWAPVDAFCRPAVDYSHACGLRRDLAKNLLEVLDSAVSKQKRIEERTEALQATGLSQGAALLRVTGSEEAHAHLEYQQFYELALSKTTKVYPGGTEKPVLVFSGAEPLREKHRFLFETIAADPKKVPPPATTPPYVALEDVSSPEVLQALISDLVAAGKRADNYPEQVKTRIKAVLFDGKDVVDGAEKYPEKLAAYALFYYRQPLRLRGLPPTAALSLGEARSLYAGLLPAEGVCSSIQRALKGEQEDVHNRVVAAAKALHFTLDTRSAEERAKQMQEVYHSMLPTVPEKDATDLEACVMASPEWKQKQKEQAAKPAQAKKSASQAKAIQRPADFIDRYTSGDAAAVAELEKRTIEKRFPGFSED